MSDPSTAVAAAPFVAALAPYIDAVVPIVVGSAITYAAYLFQRWTGQQISDGARARITEAAQTQAGLAVAQAEDNLAHASINARSQIVADGARWVSAQLAPDLKTAGVTPGDVAHIVAGEIGKLQAQMTTTTVPAPARTPSS